MKKITIIISILIIFGCLFSCNKKVPTYPESLNYTNTPTSTSTLVATPTPIHPFVKRWGNFGTADGWFKNAYGIAARNGYVYVADTGNNRIQKFNSEGGFITKWGSLGSNDYEFNQPKAIAIDQSGKIYIADTGNNRIQKYDSDGNSILVWGSYGSGNSNFDQPTGIAVDKNNYVYVADNGNNRIQKFTASGVFVMQWDNYFSGTTYFNIYPNGIAVFDSSDLYPDIYVTQPSKSFGAILKFKPTGINSISSKIGFGVYVWPDIGGVQNPFGVAVNSKNEVFVTDPQNALIKKYNSSGNYLCKFGTAGSNDGQFAWPYGIAVDTSTDDIYVIEYSNFRVQKFSH